MNAHKLTLLRGRRRWPWTRQELERGGNLLATGAALVDGGVGASGRALRRVSERPGRNCAGCLLALVWLSCLLAVGFQIRTLAQPVLSVGSATIWPGGIAALPVGLLGGTNTFGGFNATVTLPAGFQVAGILPGNLFATNQFIVDSSAGPGPNDFSVLAYSTTNTISGSGTLVSLVIRAGAGVPPGVASVGFRDDSASFVRFHALLSVDGSVSLAHTTTAGQLNVISTSSDSNHSGVPDVVKLAFGIDPANTSLTPSVSLLLTPSGFSLVFPTSGFPWYRYRVVRSGTLSGPVSSWTVFADNISGTGQPVAVAISQAAAQGFFAVIAEVTQ